MYLISTSKKEIQFKKNSKSVGWQFLREMPYLHWSFMIEKKIDFSKNFLCLPPFKLSLQSTDGSNHNIYNSRRCYVVI